MSKVQATDSGSTWKHWRVLAVLSVLVFVAAPVAVLAGCVTYVALGRKPRREAAWWTAAAGLALGVVLYRLRLPYGSALGEIVRAVTSGSGVDAGPVVAVGAWGVAAGVTAGALMWRWLLKWRESDALQGPHRRDERIDLEAKTTRRRTQLRQQWAHTPAGPWWTRPVTEPRRVLARLGGTVPEPRKVRKVDSKQRKHHFVLGRCLDGDMFTVGSWAWLAYRSHVVILGRTRHGKSETAQRQAQESLMQDWAVIMLNCKEPDSRQTGPSARLAAYAEARGKTWRVLAPVDGYRYDPMRGDLDQMRARLLSIEEFSDPYYEAASTLLLDLALRLQAQAGEPIESVPGLIWTLASGGWQTLAADSKDPMVARLAEALGDREVQGAVMRWAAQAVRLRAWIAPQSAGGFGFGDADVIGVDLPTSTESDAARALLRCMLTDLESWVTDRRRRDMGKKVRLIVDEISALDADPIIMRRLLNLMERAAGAGVYVTVIAQGPSALGDERTSEALLTNAAVLTYQQSDGQAVERLAKLAGTKKAIEASSQSSGWGRTGMGSMRLQEQMNLPFNVLRRLEPGECALIDNGKWCRISAGMTGDAFGAVPGIAALAQTSEPDWKVRALPGQAGPAKVEQHQAEPFTVNGSGETERRSRVDFDK